MPQTSVNEKLLRTSPPQINSAIEASSVVRPVKIVLEKMSLMLLLSKSYCGIFFIFAQILSDAVISNDRIVDRITCQRQDCRYRRQAEIHVKQ